MELIYLYIEDDEKNIKDCEFNFSPEYKIHYDKNENQLSVEKRDDYVPNFWEADNVFNITAIIGKNGSGKSNLLNTIVNPISKNNVIYLFKAEYLYCYTNIQALTSDNKTEIKSEFCESIPNNCHPIVYHNSSIYQSIYLDKFRNKSSIDISLRYLLIEDGLKHSTFGSSSSTLFIYHGYESTIRQLEYLIAYKSFNIEDIKLPESSMLKCETFSFNKKLNNNKEQKDIFKKIKDFFTRSLNQEKEHDDYFKALWYQSLVLELYSYCLDMNIDYEWNSYERSQHYRARAWLIFTTFGQRKYKNAKDICNLFYKLQNIIDNIQATPYGNNLLDSKISFEDAKLFLQTYSQLVSIYLSNIYDKKSYKEFDRQDLFYEQGIKILWEYTMSSGEEAFINFLANLYYARKQLSNQ